METVRFIPQSLAVLLGQGLVGGLDKDGQMVAARLGVLQTLLAQQTCIAIRFICLLSAVEVVPNFVPPGLQLEAFAMWTHVALVLGVVGKLF